MASTCWSIWLSRNEVLFTSKRLKSEELEFLIRSRVEKWGKATKILSFGNDPLWKLNPHGAIALYSHKISEDYWRFKQQSFDCVCAVDGAWGSSSAGNLTGGIEGCIKGSGGSLLYVFSGNVKVYSAVEAEIEAILHVISVLHKNKLLINRVVIYSDSTNAIEQIR